MPKQNKQQLEDVMISFLKNEPNDQEKSFDAQVLLPSDLKLEIVPKQK